MNVRHVLYHWTTASNLLFFKWKSFFVCGFPCVITGMNITWYISRDQRTSLRVGFYLLLACFRASCSLQHVSGLLAPYLPKFSSFCLPSHHRSAWITDAGFMWVLGIWTSVFRSTSRSTLLMELFLLPSYGFFFNISVMSACSIKFKVIEAIIIKNSLR